MLKDDRFQKAGLEDQLGMIDRFYQYHSQKNPEITESLEQQGSLDKRMWKARSNWKNADNDFDKAAEAASISVLAKANRLKKQTGLLGNEEARIFHNELNRIDNAKWKHRLDREDQDHVQKAAEVLQLISDQGTGDITGLKTLISEPLKAFSEAGRRVLPGVDAAATIEKDLVEELKESLGGDEGRFNRVMRKAKEEVRFDFKGDAIRGVDGTPVIKPIISLESDDEIVAKLKKLDFNDSTINSFLEERLPPLRKQMAELLSSLKADYSKEDVGDMSDLDFARKIIKETEGMPLKKIMGFFSGLDASLRTLAGSTGALVGAEGSVDSIKEAGALRFLAKEVLDADFSSQLGEAVPDLALALSGGSLFAQTKFGTQVSGKILGSPGLAGASITGGGVAGLKTFGQAREKGLSYGKSLGVGLLQALTTAGVTRVFGTTGVEAAFAKGSVGREATKEFIKPFLKGATAEGLEEATDELVSHFTVQSILDPKQTFGQTIEQAVDAAMVGGVLGGSISVTSQGNQIAEGYEEVGMTKSAEAVRNRLPEEEASIPNEDITAPVELQSLPESEEEVSFLKEEMGIETEQDAAEQLADLKDAASRGELDETDQRALEILSRGQEPEVDPASPEPLPENQAEPTDEIPIEEDPDASVLAMGLPISKETKEAFDKKKLTVRRKLEDAFVDLKKSQERTEKGGAAIADPANPHQKIMITPGRTGERGRQVHEEFNEPLLQELRDQDVPNGLKDLEDLAYALHATERNEQIRKINPAFPDGGSGMTDQESSDIINAMQADGRYDKLKPLVDELIKFNRDTLRLQLNSGLITLEAFRVLTQTYGSYVPLKGIDPEQLPPGALTRDSETEGIINQGRGFQAKRKQLHRAMGRATKADDIYAHSIQQRYDAIANSEKNKVAQALLNYSDAGIDKSLVERAKPTMVRRINPSTGKVERVADPVWLDRPENKDTVVTVKVGGKNHYIRILDGNLARNWKNVDPATAGIFGQIMGGITGFNRYLATMLTQANPDFVLPNFVRDFQTAQVNISEVDAKGVHRDLLKNIPGAMSGIRREHRGGSPNEWTKTAREFAEDGGKMVFFGMKDFESTRKQINNSIKRANRKIDFTKPPRALWKFVSDYNTVFENATRLSAYKALIDAGMTRPQAANFARNMTVNFTKKGEWSPALNALYLFFQASVNGSARMLSGFKRSGKIRAMFGGVAGLGAAQAVMNSFMGGEDEETGESRWNQIPDHIKERNMIFMFGDDILMIPLPYGYNAIHSIGRNTADVVMGNKSEKKAAIDQLFTFAGAFNPVGSLPNFSEGDHSSIDSAVITAAPTITRPFVEASVGIDGLGRKLYPERMPGDRSPDSQMYFGKTTAPAKWAAETINEWSGGSADRKGDLDFHPALFDHIWNSWTGGPGKFASRSMNVFNRWSEGLPVEWSQIPVTRRFFMEIPRYQSQSLFYQIGNEISVLEKEKKRGEASFSKEDQKLFRMRGRYSKIRSQVGKIREKLYESQDIRVRHELENDIYEKINKFLGEAVDSLGSDKELRKAVE